MKKAVVISLGGSMIFKGSAINVDFIKRFAGIVRGMESLGIVVGGGSMAAKYIEAAKQFNEDNYDLDEIGISVTHANARLVKAAVKGARFFDHLDEAVYFLQAQHGIAVMGGMFPGETTDTVAALLAESMNARFVNVSDVDGIYSANPKVFKNARKYHVLSPSQLVKLALEHDSRRPRENFVIDALAAKILARSGVEAHFVSGRNLDDVKNAILGKHHSGTVILE